MDFLNNLIELWTSHKVIGTIVGIIIIAFIYEVYMLPFRIKNYIDEKRMDIKRRDLYARELLLILGFITVQQDLSYRSENSKEYIENIKEQYDKVLEAIKSL